MSKGFRFLEDIVLADAAFEATGDTLEEAIEAATEAIIETMADSKTVSSEWTYEIESMRRMSHHYYSNGLSQLVFLKDARGVVFHKAPLAVWHDQNKKRWTLHGTIFGEHIKPSCQTLRSDIKAVTKHQYALTKKKESG